METVLSKQSIPNILSVTRVLLSLSLLLFFKQPVTFLIVYLVAGFTDAADGYWARKFNAQSKLGATLDSVGDFFMYTILLLYLFVEHTSVIHTYGYFILLIFFIRVLNILIGFARFGRLVMIHTIANKAAGLLVYCVPVVLIVQLNKVWLWLVCLIALLAAVEEMLLLFATKGKTIDLDRKSIFIKQ